MKRYVTPLIILTALALSACAANNAPAGPAAPQTEEIPVVIYSDNAYPPYSYEEQGAAKGIYVEILNVAFSRLRGYSVRFEPVPWQRGLNYLEAGIGFGLIPPYYRPQARPWMDVSVPILDESISVFCAADVMQTPRLIWPQDYAGLSVGNNVGFATFTETPATLKAQYDITIENVSTTEAGLLHVANRQSDCYINDRLSVLWELSQLQKQGKYKPDGGQAKIVEGATLVTEQGHIGYTNADKGAFAYKADFVSQMDRILTAMKESGEIQQIVEQFINQP